GRPGGGHGQRNGPAQAPEPDAARARVRRRRPLPSRPSGDRAAREARRAGREPGGARGRGARGCARGGRRRPARGMSGLIAPELAREALARALSRGGDFAEVYAEDRRSFALALDDRRLERPQGGAERGAAVRVVSGDSTYFGHVDGLAEQDLMRVAESVAQAVHGDAREPAALSAAKPAEGHRVELRPEDVEAARKADVLRSCDETA